MAHTIRITICVAAAAALVAWNALPDAIVLDIPVVEHRGGGPFWHGREVSALTYADSHGVLHIHRLSGTSYPDTQGWSTADEAFAFFDAKLAVLGWSVVTAGGDDNVLPEGRLLEANQVRQYTRPGAAHPKARVILAIWPIRGNLVKGFHVSLVTANPSLLYVIASGFD